MDQWLSSGCVDGRVAARASQEAVCLPDGFTGEQARLVIEKFMRDNPAKLHQSATFLVALHSDYDSLEVAG
jgi:hypothetical protein